MKSARYYPVNNTVQGQNCQEYVEISMINFQSSLHSGINIPKLKAYNRNLGFSFSPPASFVDKVPWAGKNKKGDTVTAKEVKAWLEDRSTELLNKRDLVAIKKAEEDTDNS